MDEFERLAKIINLKKVYRIYPISYINEQINDYNSIKNSKILQVIETLERLVDGKQKQKESHVNTVEMLQNRLEKYNNYNRKSSLSTVGDKFSAEEQRELSELQDQIDSYRFQISKLQLQKLRGKEPDQAAGVNN